MSEKRYKRFYVSESENQLTIYDNEGLDDYYHLGNDERDVKEICKLLNEQQSTISALKDIFKGIITYSEWDSKKPYCSLGIAVDRKTYYKIREILNE